MFTKKSLKPGPTVYAIRFVGMLSETVEQELPSLSNLLVKNTEDLLYHLKDTQKERQKLLVGDGSQPIYDYNGRKTYRIKTYL